MPVCLVIAACGATPSLPEIHGAEQRNAEDEQDDSQCGGIHGSASDGDVI
jgi:hypothetical protein